MGENFFVTHKELLGKLLDWPFLLFTLFFISLIVFRKEIRSVLSRGDITVSWGEGRSIRLYDISDHLDKELDQIRDDLDDLKQTVQHLHANEAELVQVKPAAEKLSPNERNAALENMCEALRDGRWRWRTLERLAQISGITEKEALNILRAASQVQLGQDKNGNHIAKLRDR